MYQLSVEHEFNQNPGVWWPVFPLSKFYTVYVRTQLRNHVDKQPVKRFKRWKSYAIYTHIKFGMLQVRENENSLRKCSGSTAQLRSPAP